jgi:nifR3 family TIM-barrel protein
LDSPEPGLFHGITVSGLFVPGNVWLAPMAGYTDAAFRAVCAKHGARLCFTEMASAEAISRNNGTTLRLLEKSPDESLTGFQIFGASPAVAAAAVRRITPLRPAIVDLNCGCSVPKVLKADCGALLLRDPALIGSIVSAMKSETDIPVSVKLRLGWDASKLTYLSCAEAAVKAGASLVTLHPRTRAQGFSGTAQWNHLRALKEACPVPVIGSGDLFSAQDCRRMIATTGCDGVMIARGCLGNPFIFSQAEALLQGRPAEARIGPGERLSIAISHLRLLADSVGEDKACRDMRKHFVAYTKGLEGGSVVRQSVVHAARIDEYEEIVESYLRD